MTVIKTFSLNGPLQWYKYCPKFMEKGNNLRKVHLWEEMKYTRAHVVFRIYSSINIFF